MHRCMHCCTAGKTDPQEQVGTTVVEKREIKEEKRFRYLFYCLVGLLASNLYLVCLNWTFEQASAQM